MHINMFSRPSGKELHDCKWHEEFYQMGDLLCLLLLLSLVKHLESFINLKQDHYSWCYLQNLKLYELVPLVSGPFWQFGILLPGYVDGGSSQNTAIHNSPRDVVCEQSTFPKVYDLDDNFTKYRVNIVMLSKMSRRCWRNIALFIQQMLQLLLLKMIMTIKMSLLLMFGRPSGRFQRNQMIIDVAPGPPVRSYG